MISLGLALGLQGTSPVRVLCVILGCTAFFNSSIPSRGSILSRARASVTYCRWMFQNFKRHAQVPPSPIYQFGEFRRASGAAPGARPDLKCPGAGAARSPDGQLRMAELTRRPRAHAQLQLEPRMQSACAHALGCARAYAGRTPPGPTRGIRACK